MVAASMSQNLMRVARTTAQTVTLTSGEYLSKLDLFLLTLSKDENKWQPSLNLILLNRDWSPKFETELDTIIGIVQNV